MALFIWAIIFVDSMRNGRSVQNQRIEHEPLLPFWSLLTRILRNPPVPWISSPLSGCSKIMFSNLTMLSSDRFRAFQILSKFGRYTKVLFILPSAIILCLVFRHVTVSALIKKGPPHERTPCTRLRLRDGPFIFIYSFNNITFIAACS